MELEWDENKRQETLATRGLDFADVALLDWHNAQVLEDKRRDYPEPRYWAFAKWGARLYFVAFCRRGQTVRVISFRKANKKEVKRYGR